MRAGNTRQAEPVIHWDSYRILDDEYGSSPGITSPLAANLNVKHFPLSLIFAIIIHRKNRKVKGRELAKNSGQ